MTCPPPIRRPRMRTKRPRAGTFPPRRVERNGPSGRAGGSRRPRGPGPRRSCPCPTSSVTASSVRWMPSTRASAARWVPAPDRDQLSRAQGNVVDPEHAGREGPRLARLVGEGSADLPALDEQLVLERHRNLASGADGTLWGRRRLRPCLNGLHPAAFSSGHKLDRIPDRHAAGLHESRDDPAGIETVDVLDREAQRAARGGRVGAELLQDLKERRSAVTHGIRSALCLSSPSPRFADMGMKWAGSTPSLPRNCAELRSGSPQRHPAGSRRGPSLFTATTILAQAEERKKEAVPAGLPRAGPPAHRPGRTAAVRAGGAGDHVLQEFLVPGRVDDREGASLGAEGHAGRVHRDVLRLLLQERVHQERVLKLHSLRPAGGLDPLRLALRNGMRVEEEPADQRGLAMINVADDDPGRDGRSRTAGPRAQPAPAAGRALRASGGRIRKGCSSWDHMKPLARSFCIAFLS